MDFRELVRSEINECDYDNYGLSLNVVGVVLSCEELHKGCVTSDVCREGQLHWI